MSTRPKKSFFDAFRSPVGSCRGMCNCGKTYYNNDSTWDFDDGEIEYLKEIQAIELDHSVGFVEFEGLTYVYSCDCWHARAVMIQDFIDGHAFQIADYLNAEKKRKKQEADLSPMVNA